ncbi:MAG: cyclic nucleotide-binding domain-containing protein [Abitibacteriaceae bacterium]|nr:cyclic nucleotide-binding domain-containing protein [Abditibacteriaceae bacterium]
MNKMNINDLQRFQHFKELTSNELQALAQHLEPVNFSAGHELFHQGDAGDCVYLLAAGQVEIRVHVPGHDDQVLSNLGEGEIFGEVSLLLHEPRTATALATTDIQTWKITRAAFQTAVKQREAWAIELLIAISKALAQRLTTVDQQLISIILDMKEDGHKPQSVKAHELEQLRNRLFTQWSF